MLIKTLIRALGFGVLLGMPVAQSSAPAAPDCEFECPSHGREYLDALLAAIDRADQVVVTEHSSPWDARDPKAESALQQQEIEYARKTLSTVQRSGFREIIRAVDPKTQDWALACGPPKFHHTVAFFESGTLKTMLKICFVCAEIDWDGIGLVTPPGEIYRGLEKFISSIGLNPERDWVVLAKQRLSAQ